MTKRQLAVTMRYARLPDAEIEAELLMRVYGGRVRLRRVHPLVEALWYIVAIIVIFGSLGYLVFEWIL